MTNLAILYLFGIFLLLSACASSAPGVLRINEIRIRGAHNSYHIRKTDVPILRYSFPPNRDLLDQQGVRGFEFDLIWNATIADFSVYHLQTYDDLSTCTSLKACLTSLYNWTMSQVPMAPMLVIWIEAKTAFSVEDWNKFDDISRSIWGNRIVTPDSVRGSYPSLVAAASAKNPWPLLPDASGKAMFVLDEAYPNYMTGQYAQLANRVAFVAHNDLRDLTTQGTALVFNSHDETLWTSLVPTYVQNFSAIVRVRSDYDYDSTTYWTANEDGRLIQTYFNLLDTNRDQTVSDEEVLSFMTMLGQNFPPSYMPSVHNYCGGVASFNSAQFPCLIGLVRNLQPGLIPTPLDLPTFNQTAERAMAALATGAQWIYTDYPLGFSAPPGAPNGTYTFPFGTPQFPYGCSELLTRNATCSPQRILTLFNESNASPPTPAAPTPAPGVNAGVSLYSGASLVGWTITLFVSLFLLV